MHLPREGQPQRHCKRFAKVGGEMVSLAGRPADQLLTILAGYRSGAIPATIMHQIVKGYTEPQLQLIAGHFAAQKPVR